jgi:pimeloyl-ACP methyl ester carboxylesterase
LTPGGPARGIVLHLSSLAGFDYEKPVIDALCHDGWLVVQIDASTVRRQENPVRVERGGDVREAAAELAEMIDNRVAEIGYAAEAVLDYLHDTRPELGDRPVMIAGYSAGALVGPAVGALLHDRIEGVVLVGGGANLLNIARRSSLTNGGIAVRWVGPPERADVDASDEDWARLEDAYLSASKLDPNNTAPYLADKPVLVLHGIFDDIVPADTGELLYERLGRPERFVYTLGHRGLFWRLPAQAGLIRRWIDRHAPRVEAGVAVGSGG